MKFGLPVAILVCGAQALIPAETDRNSLIVGSAIASCLLSSCAIFRGTILTDLPKPAGKIVLRVDEVFYGLPDGTSELEVPYTNRPSPYSQWMGPNQPWELTATKNTSLTVVLIKGRSEASFEATAI